MLIYNSRKFYDRCVIIKSRSSYHNREEHDGGLGNKTSYGYLINGTKYFTTMAYKTEQHDVWIPYFSSMNMTYNGLPIGDAQNDNSKTLHR